MKPMSSNLDDAGSAVEARGQPASTASAVLCCDLSVDPAREAAFVEYFHKVFRPCAATFAGFRGLKLLKLKTLIQGGDAQAPGARYCFQLAYESEALRQVWNHSPEHAALWPTIENMLVDKRYPIALYEEA